MTPKPPRKVIAAEFYATASVTGRHKLSVRDWLLGLDEQDRKIVGRDIAEVEFGWPDKGPPLCKPLGGGVWEVRSTIRGGRVEARTYFAIDGKKAILLNGHDGKGEQDEEIRLARGRWADYQARNRKGDYP